MLDIKDVHKSFGGVHALNGCTFAIQEKQITALIGPNGSGKTTLFDTISSLNKQDSGTIHFKDVDISNMKPHEVAMQGISRTFQDPRLFHNLTIQDHIEIALLDYDELIWKSVFRKTDLKKKCVSYFKEVGLDKPLDTLGSDLSYGQRKLLDLAIAMAKPHDLIMLDEPVAGVNPKLRESIKKILNKLVKKGETILLIEHDMNFVMDMAKEVFVIDQGAIIASGTPKKIRTNPKVLEAYLGE